MSFSSPDPEYAEVYGVPFSFIPTAGAQEAIRPSRSTRVRAIEERAALAITFPRVTGYRYDLGTERLEAAFGPEATLSLSTRDVPTWTEAAPIVGESSVHTLDDLKQRRLAEVAFALARLTLEKYFRADDGPRDGANEDVESRTGPDLRVKAWLFPQILAISRRWLAECLVCQDDTFPQLLLLVEPAHDAVDRIYRSIVATTRADAVLVPILRPFDVTGSTQWVDFDTTKPVFETHPDKSHVSHVVADTGSWEQKLAQTLESMPEVHAYVKNQGLGFTIPDTVNDVERQYVPDFLVRTGGGLTLVVEVSGEERKDKAAKVATARTLWIPAVNHHGGFGRWAFVEITDPWNAQGAIRQAIETTMVL
ncbi:MAG: hypothetical protein ABIX28_09685 [Vicinamibacterales bacterium]